MTLAAIVVTKCALQMPTGLMVTVESFNLYAIIGLLFLVRQQNSKYWPNTITSKMPLCF